MEQWDEYLRVNVKTHQIRPDLLEVRTTRGTVLGTYQRIKHLGMKEK